MVSAPSVRASWRGLLLKEQLHSVHIVDPTYIKLHVCVSVYLIVSPSVPILRSLHVTNGKPGLTLPAR